jgi:hypothetical protein
MAKTKSDYGHIGDFRPTLVSSQEIDDMLGEALNDKKPGFFRRFKKRFLKSAISFFQKKN